MKELYLLWVFSPQQRAISKDFYISIECRFRNVECFTNFFNRCVRVGEHRFRHLNLSSRYRLRASAESAPASG